MELQNEYKQALSAMQDIARFSKVQVVGDDRPAKRAQLVDARNRRDIVAKQAREISTLLMRSKDKALTIENLTEKRLLRELEATRASFARPEMA